MKQIATLLFVLLLASSTFAANPADVTLGYRIPSASFVAARVDKESWSAYACYPIGERSLLTMSKDEGLLKEAEVSLHTKLTPTLQVGVRLNNRTGRFDDRFDEHSVVVDYQNGNVGFGAIFPLQPGAEPEYGPRLKVGSFIGYASFSKSANLIGTAYIKGSYRADAAIGEILGQNVYHLRGSKTIKDRLTLEVRYKNLNGQGSWALAALCQIGK